MSSHYSQGYCVETGHELDSVVEAIYQERDTDFPSDFFSNIDLVLSCARVPVMPDFFMNKCETYSLVRKELKIARVNAQESDSGKETISRCQNYF